MVIPLLKRIEQDRQQINPLYLKIEIIPINEVMRTPRLLATARSLSLGRGSGMNLALDLYTQMAMIGPVNARAYFANYCGLTVGWSLLTYEDDGLYFHPSIITPNVACSHTFIKLNYRGCGIGLKLLGKVLEAAMPDKVCVYAHNAPYFFNKLAALYSNIVFI